MEKCPALAKARVTHERHRADHPGLVGWILTLLASATPAQTASGPYIFSSYSPPSASTPTGVDRLVSSDTIGGTPTPKSQQGGSFGARVAAGKIYALGGTLTDLVVSAPQEIQSSLSANGTAYTFKAQATGLLSNSPTQLSPGAFQASQLCGNLGFASGRMKPLSPTQVLWVSAYRRDMPATPAAIPEV